PGDAQGRARVYQWTFWAITNVQPDLLEVMFAGMGMRGDKPLGPEVHERVARQLEFLDGSLAGKQFLLRDRFTVAGVNRGSVVSLAHVTNVLAPAKYPNASAWLGRLRERPAWKKVIAS